MTRVTVVSVRDYDRAVIERPPVGPLLLRVLAPPSAAVGRMGFTRQPLLYRPLLVFTEAAPGWRAKEHSTRYRAVGRTALTMAAKSAALTMSLGARPTRRAGISP